MRQKSSLTFARRLGYTRGKSTDESPTTTVSQPGTHARAVHWWTDRGGLVPMRHMSVHAW
jgi:hypothetical protein